MGIESESAELSRGVFVVAEGPSVFVDLMTREVSGGAKRLIDGSVVKGGRFFWGRMFSRGRLDAGCCWRFVEVSEFSSN